MKVANIDSKTARTVSHEPIIAPHRIIWSLHSGRWWVGCYIS